MSEPTAARRRSWWPAVPGLSARFRILLWCSLLVAAALAASIVATRVILLQHLSKEVDTELHNELNEVSKVELSGIDPRTKQPFVDSGAALSAALARAVPAKSQELLAISDGRVVGESTESADPGPRTKHSIGAQVGIGHGPDVGDHPDGPGPGALPGCTHPLELDHQPVERRVRCRLVHP